MRRSFSRMSYFTTLVVPMAVALLIALFAVTHPQWPRIYFIVSFLAALVLFPGITLGLKLGCTPLEDVKVTFFGVGAPGIIRVRLENGQVVGYPHKQLYALYLDGVVTEGEILLFRFLENDIISWKSLSRENANP
ncbi:MAG: hypothetical protein AB1500_09240 [Bacillota bacterium]